jgi:hypothetical protein
MRAKRKLDPCDEKCEFNTSSKCCLGIRSFGCFNDKESNAYQMVMSVRRR